MTDRDDGFRIVERLFDADDMQRVGAALDSGDLERTKAGARHVLRHPVVWELAARPELARIAATFIGATAIPFRATLFNKSAASNWLVAWHQDTALPLNTRVDHPSWGPWTVKHGVLHAIAPAEALATVVALRVHLDHSSDTNGPLRVLPSTHANGVLAHGEIQRLASVGTPVTCAAPAGSVVAMRPLIVHASSKGTDGRPRRVLHIEYAARIRIGPGIELAVG